MPAFIRDTQFPILQATLRENRRPVGLRKLDYSIRTPIPKCDDVGGTIIKNDDSYKNFYDIKFESYSDKIVSKSQPKWFDQDFKPKYTIKL